MNSYELSRNWFDWSFENPEKVSPNHSAIYFFAIEHCNRLGWKEKFGFPTQMAMDALGIKNHNTYSKYFNDLIDWGFFNMIQKSRNQYSANIISISTAVLKNNKALSMASYKHALKQVDSKPHSIDSINKHNNIDTFSISEEITSAGNFDPLNNPDQIEVNAYIDESQFLKDWSDARLHFDKNPTNIKKLDMREKSAFQIVNKDYSQEDIRRAIKGLFIQKNMFAATRLRPSHFLENIEKYLDCEKNKIQLFGDNKAKKEDRL